MDTLACAAPNGLDVVRMVSEGYFAVEISLDSLLPRDEEQNTSAALVRGMAAKLTEMGYALSGFDAYAVSNVIAGAVLSSSTSFEVLLGGAGTVLWRTTPTKLRISARKFLMMAGFSLLPINGPRP